MNGPYVSVLLHLKFVVSVLVTVSAEIIGQLEFRFGYRTETKIVVSVVHYTKYTWFLPKTSQQGKEYQYMRKSKNLLS